MKKLYTLILICLTLKSFGQGIPCNPNTFWASSGGNVEEFTIIGTTITSNGLIVTSPPPVPIALAWCNNLVGGSFSPTFFGQVANSFAFYYDGSLWVQASNASSACPAANAGGNGNYLYYNAGGGNCIERFGGTTFTQLYTNPNLMFTVADLAVDDAGNAWCLMGASPPVTDSIIAISPSGQVVYKFPFNMNTGYCYGCFLLNGILYIAFGSGNLVYPNSLLPVTFTASAAVAGIPLSFNTYADDLASCNAGMPLVVTQNSNQPHEMILYPNIASDYITCSMYAENNDVQVNVINTLGETAYSKSYKTIKTKMETTIDISHFSKGIYFVTIDNGMEKVVKKFIKN